jgi:hypothetical protein
MPRKVAGSRKTAKTHAPLEDAESNTKYAYPANPLEDAESNTKYAYVANPLEDAESNTKYAYPANPLEDAESNTKYAYPANPLEDAEAVTKYAYQMAPSGIEGALRLAEAEHFAAARNRKHCEFAVREILRFLSDLVEKEHADIKPEGKSALVASMMASLGGALLPAELRLVRAIEALNEAQAACKKSAAR